jgi:hypothetical protein
MVIGAERHRGIAAAERDWHARTAVIFASAEHVQVDDVQIDIFVDRQTGLLIGRRGSDLGFSDAYNSRVKELIRVKGVPSWNAKTGIPESNELIDLLDTSDLPEIIEFPYRPAANFVLMRRGSVTFGNSTYSSRGDGLSIASEKGGLRTIGQSKQKVYSEKRGNTIVVRNGNEWVGVFDVDGRQIASAWRFR